MIAAARLPVPEPSARALAQGAGERLGLVDVVEAKLGDDPLPLGPDHDLVAERRLERVAGRLECCGLLRIDRHAPWLRFWLASQPNPVLGLAHRPTAAQGVAGEATADIVAAGTEQGAAMALAELAALQQLQGLVGKLEQTDQIGDGGAAAADTAGQLLFGQPEVLDQGGAGLGLIDWIEVLADHVLDQRRLQALGFRLLTDDRRHLLEPSLLGRAPAT